MEIRNNTKINDQGINDYVKFEIHFEHRQIIGIRRRDSALIRRIITAYNFLIYNLVSE